MGTTTPKSTLASASTSGTNRTETAAPKKGPRGARGRASEKAMHAIMPRANIAGDLEMRGPAPEEEGIAQDPAIVRSE